MKSKRVYVKGEGQGKRIEIEREIEIESGNDKGHVRKGTMIKAIESKEGRREEKYNVSLKVKDDR